MPDIKSVKLADIAFDAGTQIRAAISESIVTDYAERMAEGVEFPPVVVFHDGNQYYMADGFHRGLAAQRLKRDRLDSDVLLGTKGDAIWFAMGANQANGHRLTDADKKHAVLLALLTWPERSGKEIAKQVGCAQTYVARLRSAQSSTNARTGGKVNKSDGRTYPSTMAHASQLRDKAADMLESGHGVQETAAALGISRGTVTKVRKETGVSVGHSRIPKEKVPAVLERLRAGDGVTEIAKSLKMSTRTVQKIRSGAGIQEKRDMSRAGTQKRRDDVRAMAERGFTTRQISAELGLSGDTIANIAKREGITIHADRAIGKSQRHDANRIVDQMALDAENLTADVGLIDFSQLDPERLASWLTVFSTARDSLGKFIRRLMKEKQGHGEAA